MSDTAGTLRGARMVRDAERRALDDRLAQVKADLSARGVGGRVADKVVADATDTALEAADVVDRHRGVVAGTLVALAAWFLRRPLVAGTRRAVAVIDRRIRS